MSIGKEETPLRLFTPVEACKHLGVTQDLLSRLVREGKIEVTRFENKTRFSKEAIQKYLRGVAHG
jgi:excisionase family DNA binding protein